ncbi:MAG: histidinol-phosphatase [Desulfococcaceae bacterium]
MHRTRDGALVSIHGGHSGEFCGHATDSLADVVAEYAKQGFAWVGLTEHMPPPSDKFRYPEEIDAGLDAAALRDRFARYVETARALQREYADRMPVFVAFETETCAGSLELVAELVREHRPDYFVGSLHHVDDIGIDVSPSEYRRAADGAGGLEGLYGRYFDQQYDLLNALRPPVVGHFDLIRIFDPDYRERIRQPAIWERICRNLRLMQRERMILDFNARALSKGAEEPYVCRPILRQAREYGVAAVPGDDSHGVSSVGQHLDAAIRILAEAGFDTRWPVPKLRWRDDPAQAFEEMP